MRPSEEFIRSYEVDTSHTSYETILALLRTDLDAQTRERLAAELKSRDRAMYNQWVEVCGGQFR